MWACKRQAAGSWINRPLHGRPFTVAIARRIRAIASRCRRLCQHGVPRVIPERAAPSGREGPQPVAPRGGAVRLRAQAVAGDRHPVRAAGGELPGDGGDRLAHDLARPTIRQTGPRLESRWNSSRPIDRNGFTIQMSGGPTNATITGSFVSDAEAQGTLAIVARGGCDTTITTTWSATRLSADAEGDDDPFGRAAGCHSAAPSPL
jgi:hypothetical protein